MIYLFVNRCHATDLFKPIGGRSAAMGRTSVCDQSLWALSNNPAGIAQLKGWQFGLYYENDWLLRETALKSGGITKAFDGVGCLGMTISQYGWSGYNENLLGVAYARSFGPHLQIGLRADCWWLHLGEGYPDRVIPSFALGIQSQLTEKLMIGASLYNPLASRLKTANKDPLPIVIRFGGSYAFTNDFLGQCEVEKDSNAQGIRLAAGLEYVVFKRFCIRAGAQHNPDLISFGVGYVTNNLHVDVAAQMHQVLGASLQVGIRYLVRSKK